MSHDLERAFGDLADSAARAAEHGILASPALEPTLHRLTTSVRRRRAVRSAAVGALALALVGGTAGAVQAGLLGRGAPVPPAETTSEPTTAAPTGTSTTTFTLTLDTFCGRTQADLEALVGTSGPAHVVDVTAPQAPVTALDAAPTWSVTVANLGAAKLSLLDASPVLVLVKGGVIVGGGPFDTGSRGPAEVGESTDFQMTQPVTACGTGDAITAGDYTGYVAVAATPLESSGQPVVNAGGPFPLTFVDPSEATPLVTADDLFPCGKPLPFDDSTVPQPAGLWLWPEFADAGWTVTGAPDWRANLTTSDERVVELTVNGQVGLAFVGSDGLVKGRTWSDAIGVQDVTVTQGTPIQFQGNSTISGCLPDGTLGGMAQAVPLEPGTYTVWAFLEGTIRSVTPDGGIPYEPDAVVVSVPPAFTVTIPG